MTDQRCPTDALLTPICGHDDEVSCMRRPYLVFAGSGTNLRVSRSMVALRGTIDIVRGGAEVSPQRWAVSDQLVSRLHARIECGSSGWQLVDLASRNGSYVIGETGLLRVSPSVPLSDHNVILIGRSVGIFRLLSDKEILAIDEETRAPFTPVRTLSGDLARLNGRLRRLAAAEVDILLTGETGVGKEVYARSIHVAGARRERPWVSVNCAALPTELIESELFGYERGAHSQASNSSSGYIAEAEGGTLFLDEIGEMPKAAQAKLLRFLQERAYYPLGSRRQRKADVRVIAATNVAPSALRPDLLARLGCEPIHIPPLRAHKEDLLALAESVLAPMEPPSLHLRAIHALFGYDWPFNVRELRERLLRATTQTGQSEISFQHLGVPLREARHPGDPEQQGRREQPGQSHPVGPVRPPGGPRRSPRPPPGKEELNRLLQKHAGNVSGVARELGRDHAVMWRFIERLGIDVERYRDSQRTRRESPISG
jgi:DNA-binding NtrC family response regulator